MLEQHLRTFMLVSPFRHLHNVGHIGRLVISVEEAIAKGTRRIVALTGPEAVRAVQRADRIEARVRAAQKFVANDRSIVTDRKRFKDANKMVNELIEVSRKNILLSLPMRYFSL